jgi:hypothetical protein
MSHLISLMPARKLYEAAKNEDVHTLLQYIDYLEGVARDFHNYAAMMSRAALGTNEVNGRGIWEPPDEVTPAPTPKAAPPKAPPKRKTKGKKQK